MGGFRQSVPDSLSGNATCWVCQADLELISFADLPILVSSKEVTMINRCAVTIRAKAPLLAWLKSLPDYDDLTLEDLNRETTAYLLPVFEDEIEREALLVQFYDLLFEEELAGWWMAKGDWPENRTLELFNLWFDVDFHSVVVDLEDAPLLDED
jgi:hypothetical protein